MNHQTILTLGGLGIGSLLLIVANWSTLQRWLPRISWLRFAERDANDPTALIQAYHVARAACPADTDLAKRTDQVFKELICRKVLRCEK